MPRCCDSTTPAKPTTVFESSELAAQAIAFDSHGQSLRRHLARRQGLQGHARRQKSPSSSSPKRNTSGLWLSIARRDLFVATGDTGRGFRRRARRQRPALLSEPRAPRALAGVRCQGQSAHRHRAGRPHPARRNRSQDAQGAARSWRFLRRLRDEQSGSHFAASTIRRKYLRRVDRRENPRVRRSAHVRRPSVAPSAAVTGRNSRQERSPAAGATLRPAQTTAIFPLPQPSPPRGGAEVVRIAPDGSPETLWTSRR